MNTETKQSDLYSEVRDFLYTEAELLDGHDYQNWLEEVVSEEINYKVPTRTTQERNAKDEFSHESWHFDEDYKSLTARVDRLESDFAWAINPPPRLSRAINNIRVDNNVAGEGTVVNDILMLVRHVRDKQPPKIFTAKRKSTLRQTNDGFKLTERKVYPDATAVGMDHLPIL